MRNSCTVHLKDPDMAHTTFDSSDLGAFTRLGCLGLEVTGPARGEEADSVGLPYHW